MSYKLVTDHWIVRVTVGDSHGNGEYTEDRYCRTEEEMKKTFEKAMESYYERVAEVAEVKVVEYSEDDLDE